MDTAIELLMLLTKKSISQFLSSAFVLLLYVDEVRDNKSLALPVENITYLQNEKRNQNWQTLFFRISI